MRLKKAITAVLCVLMAVTILGGCGNSRDTGKDKKAKGSVYYLNFKPEQADDWKEVAKKYTKETGVEVNVVTAASGTYESTLKSEMAKSEAPTLFQVNGPVGLASWKDYCYDLSDSRIYKELNDPEAFALKNEDGSVAGVAYVIETYGLIYNKALMKAYCEMDGAVIKSADEITNFDTLKKVADDIQSKKDQLGIEGAFTSAGFDSSSDWRFKTHLANVPIFYEYQADGITSTEAVKGTYLDNYKQIFDLYINDSTSDKTLLSGKTGEDASSEFALGEAVFYQNDIQATLDFLDWLITSDEGREALSEDMGFETPFKTFDGEYESDNPLVVEANKYIEEGKTSVAWYFTTMPSENWKNGVGSALLEYAQGTGDWSAVETAFVDGWAKEYAAANQ